MQQGKIAKVKGEAGVEEQLNELFIGQIVLGSLKIVIDPSEVDPYARPSLARISDA